MLDLWWIEGVVELIGRLCFLYKFRVMVVECILCCVGSFVFFVFVFL